MGVVAGIIILILLVGLVFWLIGERWRLMRRSTWEAMRAAGLRNLLNFKAVHMYIYGCWTNQYSNLLFNHLLPKVSARARQRWAHHYHGKVITHEHAEAIVTLDHDIPLRDLEQIIPYPVARDLVLKGPPDLAAYECCCRHARANPCQPTQVCMVVGQLFVDFVLEHHPNGSRRLTQSEALELLREEHERGHLHSAWFKDVMLNRFYSICNCCKCCCGGIQVMTKLGMPMMASSGYVAQVDTNLCATCGTCVDICPFLALSLDESSAALDWDKCMGCGVCVDKCQNKAINLVRDEAKGVPLDVRLLA